MEVGKLFEKFPVRRHQLSKNKKKQVNKLTSLLLSYSLSSPSIQFHLLSSDSAYLFYFYFQFLKVKDFKKRGKKRKLLETKGEGSLKSTISSLFGPKLASSLLYSSLRFSSNKFPSETERGSDSFFGFFFLDFFIQKLLIGKKKVERVHQFAF